MEINNQYLLYMELAATAGKQAHQVTSNKVLACADLWHGIKELLVLPLDQLHPQTALANGHDQYVKTAVLTRLRDGSTAVRTLVLPSEDHIEGSRHVFLIIDSALKETFSVRGLQPDLSISADQQRMYFSFGLRSEDDRFLYPSKSYADLWRITLETIHNPEMGKMPHPFSVIFNGFDLSQAYAAGSEIAYQAVSRQYYVMNETEAMIRLLRTPSSHFDKMTAFAADQTHYYIKAGISNYLDPDSNLAETVVVRPPAGIWNLADEKESGRLLAVENQLLPTLNKMGFAAEELHSYGQHHVVQLDHWTVTEQLLSPVEAYKQVLVNITNDASLKPTRYPFSLVLKTSYNHNKEGFAPTQVAQREVFVESDSLFPLIYLMINRSPSSYDLKLASQRGIDEYVTFNAIHNADGTPIFTVCRENVLPAGMGKGIYIGIAEHLMNHPELQRLAPDQLLQDSADRWSFHNNMKYIRVGYFGEDRIHATTGFVKFGQLAASLHFAQLIERYPLKAQMQLSAAMEDEPYQIRLAWKFTSPQNNDTQLFHHHFATSNPQYALLNVEIVAAQLLKLSAETNRDMPIELDNISVINWPGQEPILIRHKDPTSQLGCRYEAFPQNMDAKATAAYEVFKTQLRSLQSLTQTPGREHPRIITDTGPDGNRKHRSP